MTLHSLLITVLRIVVGTILLFAGIAKLTSFSIFIADVAAYQILPSGLVKPTSYLFISAEITVGIALCIGYFSRGAGILSAFLFLIFSVALVIVLLKKLPVNECGCNNILFSLLDYFGFSISTTPNWKMVFVDFVLALASIGVGISKQQGYGLESLIGNMGRSDTTV